MSQYIPDRCSVDTSRTAHSRPGTCATYRTQTAYRENLSERERRKEEEDEPSFSHSAEPCIYRGTRWR